MDFTELEGILSQLKSLEGQDTVAMEQRVNLLKMFGHIAHRLLFVECFKLSFQKLKSGQPPETPEGQKANKGDLADLYRFKPRGKQQAQRTVIAQEICGAIFEEADNTGETDGQDVFSPRGLWPRELVRIYNLYKDKKLQDFIDPAVPSRWEFSRLPEPYRTEWLDSLDEGNFEISASIGSALLHWVDSKLHEEHWQRRHRTKLLWQQLADLQPPMTWGEVMWNCVSYLTDPEEKERRKELDQFFAPSKRHCITCGRTFKASKYNPGRQRCPRCSTRVRVQRWREKKRNESKRYN